VPRPDRHAAAWGVRRHPSSVIRSRPHVRSGDRSRNTSTRKSTALVILAEEQRGSPNGSTSRATAVAMSGGRSVCASCRSFANQYTAPPAPLMMPQSPPRRHVRASPTSGSGRTWWVTPRAATNARRTTGRSECRCLRIDDPIPSAATRMSRTSSEWRLSCPSGCRRSTEMFVPSRQTRTRSHSRNCRRIRFGGGAHDALGRDPRCPLDETGSVVASKSSCGGHGTIGRLMMRRLSLRQCRSSLDSNWSRGRFQSKCW
jgi:hypothetical protein